MSDPEHALVDWDADLERLYRDMGFKIAEPLRRITMLLA